VPTNLAPAELIDVRCARHAACGERLFPIGRRHQSAGCAPVNGRLLYLRDIPNLAAVGQRPAASAAPNGALVLSAHCSASSRAMFPPRIRLISSSVNAGVRYGVGNCNERILAISTSGLYMKPSEAKVMFSTPAQRKA